MINVDETDPDKKSGELLSDEEIPSYQLPRDDSSFDEENTPARLPFCRLPSSVRAASLPFSNHLPLSENKPGKSCSAPDIIQKSSFKALGMADKDISWASSMESIVEECTLRNDFNTIEKATFFPHPNAVQSKQIQPRALFPKESDESLGLKPLDSSLHSDDIPPYSRAMRLSDVCDVLKSLNVVNRPPHDVSENQFDFIDNGPKSPSVFSQKSEETDLFEETKPTQPPSPSIFSPETKPKKIPSPRLSPIAEVKTSEDSALEIILDESLPNGFSTPLKKPSPVKLVSNAPLEQVVQVVPKLAARVKKKLYGVVSELKPIHVIDDEILQSWTESEQTVCNFLNTKSAGPKNLPESKGLIPFSQLLGDSVKLSRKRSGDELQTVDSKKQKTSELAENLADSSMWNCAMLSDSQAEILDKAADLVEKTLTKPEEPQFMGFKSGNHKIVNPSAVSLAKAGKIFDECLEEKILDEPVGEFKVPARLKKIQGLNIEGNATKKIPELMEVNQSAGFVGFQTGNSRLIQPSAASLSRVGKMFDGCDVPAVCSKTGKNQSVLEAASASLDSDSNIERLTGTKKIPELTEVNQSAGFVGFQTGNSRMIQPSAASLSRVGKMFDGCDVPAVCSKTGKNQSVLEAASASLDSDSNIERLTGTKKIPELTEVTKSAGFVGFQTGNSRLIQPSAASLSRVGKMFDGCDSPAVCSKTGKNQAVLEAASTDSDSNNERFTGTKKIPEMTEVTQNAGFVGFQTGNSRLIQPSAASLSRVGKIFDGCDSPAVCSKTGKKQAVLEAASTSIDSDSNIERLTGTKKIPELTEVTKSAGFVGFQTGNSRLIQPSAASLSRVGKIFDGCDSPAVCSKTGKKQAVLEAASTSIDSDSNIERLTGTKKIPELTEVTQNAGFVGFQTGNSRLIQPSAASLSRVGKIFDGCDVPNVCSNPSVLDAPASKNIENLERRNSKSFGGFQTGNARFIKPTTASLSKIRNLFDGCDVPIDTGLQIGSKPEEKRVDCRTPVSNRIQPSEESLEKIRDVFENETQIETTIMEESYSTFVENTDWDVDAFLPEQSKACKIVNESSSVKSVVKRKSSPLSESTKRQKMVKELTGSQLIHQKRKAAREAQARMIDEKKGTERSVKGSHLMKKECARQKTWKEFLPHGPKIYERSQLRDLGVVESVIDVDFDNARDFRFSAKDYYSSTLYENNTSGWTIGDGFSVILDQENSFGAREMENAFLAGPGVAPELLSSGWVTHHYGLIVWKLACYERSCGDKLAGSGLNPDNVMLLLKYRYDREIDRSQSSALKRILERDDAAGKPLILTVLRVTKLVEGNELLVSDGWYTCPARTDCALNNAIKSGKIRVGTKIMTIGAELMGCEQGVPPLERPDGVFLKLATNSTRRVRWYTKMGFAHLLEIPAVPLSSILPGGGFVACTRVLVVRVYPLLFVEKTAEGKNVTRNSRAEQKEAMAFQLNLETKMTKLYNEIENDMSNKTRNGFSSSMRISEIDCPERLYSILETAEDPGSIEASMTEEQKSSVMQYKAAREFQSNRMLEDKMKELKMTTRSVRTVLRVRLVDINDSENAEQSAVLSWWQPDEELCSVFTEGSVLSLFNVSPGSVRSQQCMYLNSSRQTKIERLSHRKTVPRPVLRPCDIHSAFSPPWGEFDIVGLVVQVQGFIDGTSNMQTVYFADTEGNYFGLIFWRGMKEFCCDDILAEGLVVGVSNVQWRRSSANAKIPCGFATETTQFALSSKSDQIQCVINCLKEELEEDIAGLIERSQDAITARLHSVTNTSLSISCNSNASVPDTSNFEVDVSPRPRYHNGFAQFPRAASTPVKSRSSLHWRLDQLQQTGEPPPLSPIPLPTTAKVSRAFKLPTILETSSTDSR